MDAPGVEDVVVLWGWRGGGGGGCEGGGYRVEGEVFARKGY